MVEQSGNGGTYRTPPYVAFKTFNTLIEDLKEHGLPTVIDRSVLRRFSGGVGSQLLSALKSLDLVDDGNAPNDSLNALVDAYDSEAYKGAVKRVLEHAYPYLASLDLTVATPSQFAEAFRATGSKEEVLRKARTFYLNAARFAEMPIGSRLSSGSAGAPRKLVGAVKRKAPATPKPVAAASPPPPLPPATVVGKGLQYELVDLLGEDGLPENVSAAIWVLIQHLAKKAAG